MLTLVVFPSKFSLLLLKKECSFWESYFLITTSTALSHWDIHKPNESQSKFGKAYWVSWLKSKEHPFRISALGICLGLTMSSRDADPKSTLLFRVKYFCMVFRFSSLWWCWSQSKFWFPRSCLNLQTVKLLRKIMHSFQVEKTYQ